VDEAQVGPAFRLDGRRAQGSIGRAALDAAIRRRVGVKSPAVYSANTFGELIGEAPAASSPETPTASNRPAVAVDATASAVACGVDLELVANLPDTLDPWEDPFYQTHFAPAEIAYCLLQNEPKPHFAARWCAKEALKKCEPALLGVDFHEIEVAREASGSPYLMHQNRRLPHALSLSHTSTTAVAVVVRAAFPAPVPALAPAPVVLPAETPSIPPEPQRRSGLMSMGQFVLVLAALAASTLALYRTYRP
jgi:phosphopantetheine--protein transferase-like protein